MQRRQLSPPFFLIGVIHIMSKKAKEYMVTMPGVCLKGTTETKKGTKVMLSDKKAEALVGKVRLMDEYNAELNGDAELTKANAELTEKLELLELANKLDPPAKSDKALVKENKKLVKTNDALGEDNSVLTARVTELEGVNADLTEQLGKLTEQLTSGSK